MEYGIGPEKEFSGTGFIRSGKIISCLFHIIYSGFTTTGKKEINKDTFKTEYCCIRKKEGVMDDSTIRLLANNEIVHTKSWNGTPVLDFIRNELGLAGVKEGCREGDCGACAVLIGERLSEGKTRYRAMTSCLMALKELDGHHLVTIEGLVSGAEDGLTPVMQAIMEENGSQCGFCTPGFVISLTAWLLEGGPFTEEDARRAIEGNLCRCTGYAPILRAASRLSDKYAKLPSDFNQRLDILVKDKIVPPSLLAFSKSEILPFEKPGHAPEHISTFTIGGGTDFYVRNPDPDPVDNFCLAGDIPEFKILEISPDGNLEIGAAVNIRDFFASGKVRKFLPGFEKYERFFASILIRNRATLGGNIMNASPVADMTSMLMALGARLRIIDMNGKPVREIPLEKLYTGYKSTCMVPGELLQTIIIPGFSGSFNFEKASKRSNLDIAAVNSGISARIEGNRIINGRISAGGVAATPKLLELASASMENMTVTTETVFNLASVAISEVKPISDVRGSADYRKQVLGRLILAHFMTLFSGEISDSIAEALASGRGIAR